MSWMPRWWSFSGHSWSAKMRQCRGVFKRIAWMTRFTWWFRVILTLSNSIKYKKRLVWAYRRHNSYKSIDYWCHLITLTTKLLFSPNLVCISDRTFIMLGSIFLKPRWQKITRNINPIQYKDHIFCRINIVSK